MRSLKVLAVFRPLLSQVKEDENNKRTISKDLIVAISLPGQLRSRTLLRA